MKLFAYPQQVPRRMHLPVGYRDYRDYKSWLRDEHCFRCFYCMRREAWFPDGHRCFGVDHIVPRRQAPLLAGDYTNLVYACNRCNAYKGDNALGVDLHMLRLSEHLEVCEDGTLKVVEKSNVGLLLLRVLNLNAPDMVAFRSRLVRLKRTILGLSGEERMSLLRDLFGFPESMPDLAARRPPDGNQNAGSERISFFAQRVRGRLSTLYFGAGTRQD